MASVVAFLTVLGTTLLAAPASGSSGASIFYVAQGGTNTANHCTSATKPCATVSHAVGAAESGHPYNLSATIEVSGTIYDHVSMPAIPHGGTEVITVTGADAPAKAPAVVSGAHGGGPVFVVSFDAQLNVDNLTVEGGNVGIDNSASGYVTVNDSTIRDNSGGDGGIFSLGDPSEHSGPGAVQISNSTLSNNVNGAVSDTGYLSIDNSTIADNPGPAGNFAVAGAVADIYNSTIADNPIGGIGGNVTLGGTILANNPGNDCSPPVTDAGGNLTDDPSGQQCGLSTKNHDVIGVNPELGPLANNGGPTETLLPAPTSPAAGAIPLGYCPPTDQRGVPRPQPPSAKECSIGAVEVAPKLPKPPVPPMFTSPPEAGMPVGTPSFFLVKATGTPTPEIKLTAGALPRGVHFLSGTGTAIVYGTPAKGTTGLYHLTFSAKNRGGTTSLALVLVVIPQE